MAKRRSKKRYSDAVLKAFRKNLLLAVIVLVLAAAGMTFAISAGNGTEDHLMFIGSQDCEICRELSPFAHEAADMLQVEFLQASFARDVPFPGYVLYYGGEATIAGFDSEEVLFESLCSSTKDAAICARHQKISGEGLDGSEAAD